MGNHYGNGYSLTVNQETATSRRRVLPKKRRRQLDGNGVLLAHTTRSWTPAMDGVGCSICLLGMKTQTWGTQIRWYDETRRTSSNNTTA